MSKTSIEQLNRQRVASVGKSRNPDQIWDQEKVSEEYHKVILRVRIIAWKSSRDSQKETVNIMA